MKSDRIKIERADRCYKEYPDICLCTPTESKFLRTIFACYNNWVIELLRIEPNTDNTTQLYDRLIDDICNETKLSREKFERKLYKIGQKVINNKAWSYSYRLDHIGKSKNMTVFDVQLNTTVPGKYAVQLLNNEKAVTLNLRNDTEVIEKDYLPIFDLEGGEHFAPPFIHSYWLDLHSDNNGSYYESEYNDISPKEIHEQIKQFGFTDDFKFIPWQELSALLVFDTKYYTGDEPPKLSKTVDKIVGRYIPVTNDTRALSLTKRRDILGYSTTKSGLTKVFVDKVKKTTINILSTDEGFIKGVFDDVLVQRLLEFFGELIIAEEVTEAERTVIIDSNILKRFNLRSRDYEKILKALNTIKTVGYSKIVNGGRVNTSYIESITDNFEEKKNTAKTIIIVRLTTDYVNIVNESVKNNQHSKLIAPHNEYIDQIPLNKAFADRIARFCRDNWRINQNNKAKNPCVVSVRQLLEKGRYPTTEEVKQRGKSKIQLIVKPLDEDLLFLTEGEKNVFSRVQYCYDSKGKKIISDNDYRDIINDYDRFLDLYVKFEWAHDYDKKE